jgi:predicted nucleic acid-binding protein
MSGGPVVSDSGPLHYLILIGECELLPRLFERLLIPSSVHEELSHPNTPSIIRQSLIALPPWLQVATATTPEVKIRGLGRGESAALQLASELKSNMILMDDFAARRTARALGFETFGTLSLLEEGARRSFIDFPSAVSKLRATNFYITEKLLQDALNRDSERRRNY